MLVLVVGGSGFIGEAVLRELQARGIDAIGLSRSGEAACGRGVVGDVTKPRLGLPQQTDWLAAVTHVLTCHGAVSWRDGPDQTSAVHGRGTANVVDLARSLPRLERLVHCSSILQFGKCDAAVGNDHHDVGQRFRSYYEWGKYLAEAEIHRAERDVASRVVRVGPVLGTVGDRAPSADTGLLAVLPYALAGWPVPLERSGRFRSFAVDVETLAAVLAEALLDEATGPIWTWWDFDRDPTVAEVLVELCRPWSVFPRIVGRGPAARAFLRVAGHAAGLPRPLAAYGTAWLDVDPAVRGDLPPTLPKCPEDVLERTAAMVHRHSRELVSA